MDDGTSSYADITTSWDIGEKTLSTARVLFESRPNKDPNVLYPNVLNLNFHNLRRVNKKDAEKRIKHQTIEECIDQLLIWWKQNEEWTLECDRLAVENQSRSFGKIKAIGWSMVTLIKDKKKENQKFKIINGQGRYDYFLEHWPASRILPGKKFDRDIKYWRGKYNVALIQYMRRKGYLVGDLSVFDQEKKKDDLAVAILQAIYDKYLELL